MPPTGRVAATALVLLATGLAAPTPASYAAPRSSTTTPSRRPHHVDLRGVQRTDRALTASSDQPAADVARSYLETHLGELGLVPADLDSLHLTRDYVDIGGTHHLSWVQEVGGLEVVGGGLRAAVDPRGRLLLVTGAPVTGLVAPAPTKAQRVPDARTALAAARAGTDSAASTDDTAVQVVYVDHGQVRAGWETITTAGYDAAVSVVDAGTAGVVRRDSLVSDRQRGARRDPGSPALYYPFFPGAENAPDQVPIDLTEQGWLDADATRLRGNNVHAVLNLDDVEQVDDREEIRPQAGHAWEYELTPFDLPGVSFCGNPYPCTWNPSQRRSWKVNADQDATQLFATANLFHDHLLAAPIGFTEAAGNFERVNEGPDGKDGDAVLAESLNGADTANGLPDYDHVDNAYMSTPPDGHAPRMAMFLNHTPHTSYPDEDPYAPTSTADEADTVYHEYTHGLSNRLVVDARGRSTLGGSHSDAMGEGWSDFYAMDYLVGEGLQTDAPGVADIRMFAFDGAGKARTEYLDCKVGAPSTKGCRGGRTGHAGGFTFADWRTISAYSPEVHDDGEIWAQTLWDVRDALGQEVTETLATRAMELSPDHPTFVDMRNAILLADLANYDGVHQDALWTAFAGRGLGYLAGAFGDSDNNPAADFSVPADSPGTAYLTGRVRDAATGQGLGGVEVTLAVSVDGLDNPTVKTRRTGGFRIGPVPVGRYGKLRWRTPGGGEHVAPVTVGADEPTVQLTLRKDWARRSVGTRVVGATGSHDFFSGPNRAIDGNTYTAWSPRTGTAARPGRYTPRVLTLRLPRALGLRAVGLDPGAGPSALGRYRVLASADGRSWARVASGALDRDDRRRLTVRPTVRARHTRFVRLVLLGNQVGSYARTCTGDPDHPGCTTTDVVALGVYGAAE